MASATRLTVAGSTHVLATLTRERPPLELGAAAWIRDLTMLRLAGFEAVDLVDSWLPFGEMSSSQLSELRSAIDESGLVPAGISVVFRSVIDPHEGPRNLDYTMRSIEAAALLGAPIVSIGFHRPLTAAQRESQFWMVAGQSDVADKSTLDLAVERVGEVSSSAADHGLAVTLELYEGALLGSPEGACRIIERVGAPNLGINADLGNLIRAPEFHVRGWEELLLGALPRMNYWHAKNYVRLESPSAGIVLSYPTDLSFGVIDYRRAVQLALDHGYRGPICIEHYEGDALGAIERGRRYIEGVMDQLEAAA